MDGATTIQGELATRLEAFLVRRRALLSAPQPDASPAAAGLAERLTTFLTAARGRLARVPEQESPPRPLLDRATLAALFEALRDPLDRARAAGKFVNPWTLAGLGRREVRNVAVLAGLWNPAMTGNAGRAFLGAFLGRLRKRGTDVPMSKQITGSYSIRTEHCITGEAETRMDLTIEGHDFFLVIEAKIDAVFGKDQRGRYIKAVKDWSQSCPEKPITLVLLASKSTRSNDQVITSSWNDVAAAAFATLPTTSDRSATHRLIDAFARHISNF